LQDIRWKAFWLLFSWLIVCLIVAAFSDWETAWLLFAIGTIAYLWRHLHWMHQLNRWLDKPDLNTIPMGSGAWEDIFAKVYHEQRRHARTKVQLSNALERFRHAAGALPDGVVLLDDDNKIEWCNRPSELHLGIALKQDIHQPIVYLVRSQEFVQYLQHHVDIDPIKLHTISGSQEMMLEIRLVSFGSNQKLLLSRDISQIEKLDAMRRDFIANASHELRTPLTVINGFLEIANAEPNLDQTTRMQHLKLMAEQGRRMQNLVEDMLVLTRLESIDYPLRKERVGVHGLLEQVQAEAEALSAGRHQISVNIDGPDITGSTDELRSAFSNLVSNAVRYTPEGGEIIISWLSSSAGPEFSVRDTGIGIKQEHLSRLTERFYRVDKGRSRETQGTGLGLAIVKHVLARHDARLRIESEPGKGSVFTIQFPEQALEEPT